MRGFRLIGALVCRFMDHILEISEVRNEERKLRRLQLIRQKIEILEEEASMINSSLI